MQPGLGRELNPSEHVLHRCDNPLCVKTPGNNDGTTHLHVGNHPLNTAERSVRGRSHFQLLRFRVGEKKARATSARAERNAVKASGYDQELVQRFVHELDQRRRARFSQTINVFNDESSTILR